MELPAQVKRCSICKLEKNIYEFSRDINKKDGLCVPCKQCRAVTGIKYRKDNKNKIILKNQKYAQYTKAHPEFINYPNKWYLNRLISNAKKRNISFNLTYQELLESNHCQNCYFCEIELKFTKLAIQAPGNHNASLDRIDSSKGYEIGNIQWTCVNCNLMKKNLQMNNLSRCVIVLLKNIQGSFYQLTIQLESPLEDCGVANIFTPNNS